MTNQTYPYIKAWGRLLGSEPHHVHIYQQSARATGAPHTAVYRKDDGSWCTVEEFDAWWQHELERLVND